MTLAMWPASLPRPMRAGFSRTLPDGRQATKNEMGPPRVRRRYSAAASALQMTIDVSADQRARFWRFWDEDTAGGSLPFWMTDWAVDGMTMATEDGVVLTTEDGTALSVTTTMLVMFGTDQPPSESPVGVRWRIAFILSIMP